MPTVDLPPVPVMCSSVVGVEEVSEAITSIEEKLNHKLTGRRCYGVSTADESGLHWRACISIQEGDDPADLGLEIWEIPGGKYAKDRIRPWDYAKDVPVLVSKFNKLSRDYEKDENRPSIEFYRRHDDLILYFPIK